MLHLPEPVTHQNTISMDFGFHIHQEYKKCKFIGIEINPDYIKIARRRIFNEVGLLWS